MKFSIFWILAIGTLTLPVSVMARLSNSDIQMSAVSLNSGAVACMERALSGESDGSRRSMFAVGMTIMRRVQLGEGSICSVTNAPGQFVGIRLASSKPWSWRMRAKDVARIVIAERRVHPFRQFRTVGMTSHRGILIGGNVYFDTGGGGRRHWRRYRYQPRYERYREEPGDYGYMARRRAPAPQEPLRQFASLIDEAFSENAR